jgi:hypothetical protein
VITEHRLALRAPSECDVVLSPELAPLFVLDAAIVAAQRIFSVSLDPSSLHPGGARYPPTRALLEAMRTLRCHIREHRRAEQAFAGGIPEDDDSDDPEDEVHDLETDNLPF